MAPSANPSTTNEDHTISLINAAVTTTSIAVNVRPPVLTFVRTPLIRLHSQDWNPFPI